MYARKDKRNFDIRGMMIYDPSLASSLLTQQVPAVAFVNHWKDLFGLNDTTMALLNSKAETCGYSAMLDQYLQYPPTGPFPNPIRPPGCNLWSGEYRSISP